VNGHAASHGIVDISVVTTVPYPDILLRVQAYSAHDQPTVEKLLDRVTANVRSFFICTRGDLLSGNIGRILRLHPSQAIFVDRVVLANIVTSGVTVWGEAMLPLIPVAPIRRFGAGCDGGAGAEACDAADGRAGSEWSYGGDSRGSIVNAVDRITALPTGTE
jgi:hypothetical protein